MLIQTYTSLPVVIAPTIKQNNKYITKSPRNEAYIYLIPRGFTVPEISAI